MSGNIDPVGHRRREKNVAAVLKISGFYPYDVVRDHFCKPSKDKTKVSYHDMVFFTQFERKMFIFRLDYLKNFVLSFIFLTLHSNVIPDVCYCASFLPSFSLP